MITETSVVLIFYILFG